MQKKSRYHSPLQENLSVPNVVWRDANHTRPFPTTPTVKKIYLRAGFTSHDQSSQGVYPLSSGVRGTTPWQDPNDKVLKRVEMKPYSIPKGGDYDCLEQPFYHVNLMASAGGFPLKLAMDEPGQLNMMVHNERMRIHPSNPLSAAYAQRVIQALEEDPLRGPMNDHFRRDLPLDGQDDDTIKRHNARSGYDPHRFRTEDAVHHPDLEAWLDGDGPPSHVEDVGGWETLFHEPVEDIHFDNPLLSTMKNVDLGKRKRSRLEEGGLEPSGAVILDRDKDILDRTAGGARRASMTTPIFSYGGGLHPTGTGGDQTMVVHPRRKSKRPKRGGTNEFMTEEEHRMSLGIGYEESKGEEQPFTPLRPSAVTLNSHVNEKMRSRISSYLESASGGRRLSLSEETLTPVAAPKKKKGSKKK